MSQYININLPVQMDFLIDTLKSLDQKSKKEIYLKVFIEANEEIKDQHLNIDTFSQAAGILKNTDIDPIQYERNLRDEWDR